LLSPRGTAANADYHCTELRKTRQLVHNLTLGLFSTFEHDPYPSFLFEAGDYIAREPFLADDGLVTISAFVPRAAMISEC
jgi:hypothetical protein